MNNLTSIGIIPDGNRRYGRKKSMDLYKTYQYATDIGVPIIKHIYEKYPSVKQIQLYALSKENLKRSKEEVSELFNLFKTNIPLLKDKVKEYDINFKFIGNFKFFPPTLKKIIKENSDFKKNARLTIYFCLGYSGRQEIIDGINKIIKSGKKQITDKTFRNYLYDPKIIDPDIIIRTSGEKRLSGFLTYESVYSELFFIKKYWPEIKPKDIDKIIQEYQNIGRRFGK